MLNHTFYPYDDTAKSFPLGDLCHQQQQAGTPVWVVTDLDGNIIINSEAERKEIGESTAKPAWVVTKGRITVNRFFTASTAMVVCAVQNVDPDEPYPPLPGGLLRKLKTGGWQRTSNPIDKGDEFCIWCGYVAGIRPVTKKDLEDGRLIRTFVGVVDTIVMSGNANQGVQVIIQARDRIKYLMDSLGTFNAADFDVFKSAGKESLPDVRSDTATPEAVKEAKIEAGGVKIKKEMVEQESSILLKASKVISRVDVIIELARRCIGHLEFSVSLSGEAASACKSVCGYVINRGYISDYTEPQFNVRDLYPVYNGFRDDKSAFPTSYYGKPQGYVIGPVSTAGVSSYTPFIGGVTRTPTLSLPAKDLQFNVVTGRRPFVLQGTQQNWLGNNQNITDRVPAEFIKFLSLQEPWPTEFFADSRSGEYWYAPRGLDYSGLYDPKRFFRTYFFRRAPKNAVKTLFDQSKAKGFVTNPSSIVNESTIHSCQAALLYREESTNINWRSNIIVTNQGTQGDSSQMVVHLKVVPYWMQDRSYPCSYYQIVDQTVGENVSELVAIAVSAARIHGKELKAATLHVLGDPSLTPGEAIQVVGSPLYSPNATNPNPDKAWITDRNSVSEYYDGYNAMYIDLLEKLKNQPGNLNEGKEGASTTSTTTTTPVASNSTPVPNSSPSPGQAAAKTAQTSADDPGTAVGQVLKATGDAVNAEGATSLSQAQIMCPATFRKNDVDGKDKPIEEEKLPPGLVMPKDNTIVFPEDPRTIWRIEAIIHKFNENPGDGFRSELALAAPF